jgi:hypothetical protein
LNVIFEDFKGNTETKNLSTIYKLPIIARDVTVNINDYTQADTFDMEIDYKNFPFDPRCIRSVGVTIYIDDMKGTYKNGQELNLIVPSSDNEVFHGFADEDTITFDDEHRAVRFSGRDFTGMFTDLPAPGVPQDTTTPLDDLIRGIIAANPTLAKITVDNRTGEKLLPISSFSPDFKPQSTKVNPRPNQNLWDLIQELVSQHALIAYIELDTLVITKPRILYGKTETKQFIYGQNVKTLEFKRKLGRKKGFNIQVISFAKKEVIKAEIPRESTAEWAKSIGLAQLDVTIPQVDSEGAPATPKKAPTMTFRFADKDKKQCIEIAQKIYEEVGRQQIEGSLVTKEMDIVETGDNGVSSCFNATLMRIGTPILIKIQQGDLEGLDKIPDILNKTTGKMEPDVATRKNFLIKRCYDADVAEAFAKSFSMFTPKFFTKSVKLTVNQESGFQMKVDFINFIELDNEKLGI